MKLSLVLPTNRHNGLSMSRIIEWASLDPQKFEFIVRDNSGSPEKRSFIEGLKSGNMIVEFAEVCGGIENAIAALQASSGDFVMFLADDDWVSVRGLESLHELACSVRHEESVSCLTGDYLVEASSGSCIFRYPDLTAADPRERLGAVLDVNAPNYLYYSAVRKWVADASFNLLARLPYRFSYHDQLVTLLYLTLGEIRQNGRVVYGYDLGEWETPEKTLAKDRFFYRRAGLPIEYDRLHHLFCAVEGALLLNSSFFNGLSDASVPDAIDVWINSMFSKFVNHDREVGYENNEAGNATKKLKEKYITMRSFNLNEIFVDICEVISVSDEEGARRYFKFWSEL